MIIGDDIEIEAGCQYVQNFKLGIDISTRTGLYFGIKSTKSDADSASLLLVDETTGLLYLAAAAATVAAQGDITVNDAASGDITVTISDEATVDLVETSGKSYYQIKWIDATGEGQSLLAGRALVMSGTVRETS